MKTQNHIIKKVTPGSIAEEMGIEAGDILLSIDGETVEDIFDYQFMTQEESLTIAIRKGSSGEEWLLEIEKEEWEDIGIEFENGLMDDYRSCCNKCIFCFIDQMPKGMRETLYFKDDDSRLSFLQGNYVTLTNMRQKDIDKIIKYHLSPINISFQTMNPELRCKMLNNRFAREALDKARQLYEAGITLNGQIVLCKGVNDGKELAYSIEQLAKYVPVLESVSVVPVGLSKYREGLYPLEPFNREDAAAVIDLIESWQKKVYEEHGLHFVHASDEWYILAGRDMPPAESYDGYLQLENGVGMLRLLLDEFDDAVRQYKKYRKKHRFRPPKPKHMHFSMATGRLAYTYIKKIADTLMELIPGLCIEVYEITNYFFGERITVSGLLTGQDIIAQLKGKPLHGTLLLPQNVLRSGEDVFLDDITLTELGKALQVEVNIVKSSGYEYFDFIFDKEIVWEREEESQY
ncbi:MAG: DUF512 domain-containing protein [Lachnospiraceae bacterium]|nr:DUF512 domain-containing protein [Lachnospiraceae bacterium]